MANEIRILVVWTEPATYLVGCLKTLLAEYNIQLFLIVARIGNSISYLDLQQAKNMKFINLSDNKGISGDDIEKIILDFNPDLALITMKRTGLFAKLARIVQQMGGLVIGANDHYWKNSWRDFANAIVARVGIFKCYDVALVAGVLGRLYARRLGFKDNRIFEGVYSCDAPLFRSIGMARFKDEKNKSWPKVFLFIGQYIPRKGLNVLLKAYSEYRNNTDNPWELWCVGNGTLSKLVDDATGVKNLGYQSSENCARIMSQSGTFILPSTVDHWGVVIHEAACAGLPVIATHECGASVELIRSSYNGFTYPAHDSNRLAQLMCHFSNNSIAKEMGENSLMMSYQIGPKIWAKRLLEDIPLFIRGRSFSANRS